MTAPGRNDPCPCGSGRKYKRCCAGASAREADPGGPAFDRAPCSHAGGLRAEEPRDDDETRLIEKLLRIEALHSRPGTAGEKAAAAGTGARILPGRPR